MHVSLQLNNYQQDKLSQHYSALSAVLKKLGKICSKAIFLYFASAELDSLT
jgi:hypothetical protein